MVEVRFVVEGDYCNFWGRAETCSSPYLLLTFL